MTTKLGGRRSIAARSRAGRVAGAHRDREVGCVEAELARRSRRSRRAGARGSRRCRPRAPSAARRRRRGRCRRSARPRSCARYSRSMQTRKPASVLPDPVGAAISVSCAGGDVRPAARAAGCVGPVGEAAPEPGADRGVEPVDGAGVAQLESGRGRGHGPIVARPCDAETCPRSGSRVDTVLRMGSLFGQETAITRNPSRPGGYLGELSDDWLAPLVPQGGVTAAVGVRAMEAELGEPGQPLRSVSTVFAGRVSSGPVEVDVSVLRRGRSMSQAVATVRNRGEEAGATSVAVFGASRPGFEFTDIEMPAVPPPDECPRAGGIHPRRSSGIGASTRRSGTGPREGPPWGTRRGRSTSRTPPSAPRGTGSTTRPWATTGCSTGTRSSASATRCPAWCGSASAPTSRSSCHPARISPCTSSRTRARDGSSCTTSRTTPATATRRSSSALDPDRGLVAYGTQMMFFVFPDGPPST